MNKKKEKEKPNSKKNLKSQKPKTYALEESENQVLNQTRKQAGKKKLKN